MDDVIVRKMVKVEGKVPNQLPTLKKLILWNEVDMVNRPTANCASRRAVKGLKRE